MLKRPFTLRRNHNLRRSNSCRPRIEWMEPRTLLTATLSVTSAGAVSLLSQTLGSTVGVSFNAGSDTYTFDDTEGVNPLTVDPAFTYTQVTGTEATLTPVNMTTQNFTSLSFDQNVENINYSVTSLGTTRSIC